jgi:ornithine cyclodeaminase/alanine dehydrogenase-like protein (mu-crystallin family)
MLSCLMLFLSDEEVRARLAPRALIEALERAFARDPAAVVMPTRTQLPLPSGGVLLLMPCHDRELPALGMKLVFVREGTKTGGPSFGSAQLGTSERVQATYLLLEPESGSLRALLDARALTELRTAATSAVATRRLAREDARTLGVFGTGRQARAHLAVLPEVRDFQRALVCGSSAARSREFVREVSDRLALRVEAADAHTLVRESDVLCTCTTASQPLFDGAWLRPGTHLNLVGAFRPTTREVDDETIRRSYVVVDTYAGALAEAGDLLIPMQRGVIDRAHMAADLHELVSGKKPGRLSAEQITLFKSVGCALEDLVAAQLVWQQTQGG